MIIKSFKIFESHDEIRSICDEYKIVSYVINSDGSIDVDGNVCLDTRGLEKIPLRFRSVNGNFTCWENILEDLDGSPEFVGGYFSCEYNRLSTLVGGPRSVGGFFQCSNNNICSFKGAPETIGNGRFRCHGNPVDEVFSLFYAYGIDSSYNCVEWINEYDVIQDDKIIW